MIRPARSSATVGSSGTLRDEWGTAAGRIYGPDTGCAAADAAAAVPAWARALTTLAKKRDALATGWDLNDPERGVLRRLHMLNGWDVACEFGNGYTDAFTDPFFFGTLQRSNHGCGAASAMIGVAAPAAKGATWMD